MKNEFLKRMLTSIIALAITSSSFAAMTVPVSAEGEVAALIHNNETTNYTSFEDACRAAGNGDTIKLLADVTIAKRMLFSNGDGSDRYGQKSNITIDGGDNGNGGHYSINNNGNLIEFPNGSGTITLNNLTITGSGKLDIKGGTVINTSESAISNLGLGGSANPKGTLTNSTINSLSTYGIISLVNTEVGNVEFPDIKSSSNSNDKPQIIGDANSTVTGTVTFGNNVATENIIFPYTLFSGEMTKPTVNLINTVFADGYTYSEGILNEASASVYAITAHEGIKSNAAAEAGETVTITITGDNYVENSLTASSSSGVIAVSEGTNNTYAFTMPAENVTLSALFDTEDTKTIIASNDKSYNASDGGGTWNDIHYLSYKNDGKIDIALEFDLTNVNLNENSSVVLKLQKKGNATYEKTNVNLINDNPWKTNIFDYALASNVNNQTVGTQASGPYGEGEVKFELEAITSNNLIDGKLYINVSMAEENTNNGNDYYAIPANGINNSYKAPKAQYLPRLEITTIEPHNITTQTGIIASASTAVNGETIMLTGNYASGSLFVKAGDSVLDLTNNNDGTYSFTMPNSDVDVSGLVNTDEKIYVVPTSVERVNGEGQNDTNNYYVHVNRGLGMTFDIPISIGSITNKELASVKLHLTRSNTAGGQTTNIYDQTSSGFKYENGEGYIAQYSGGNIEGQKLNSVPNTGIYKLLLSYDSTENEPGNYGNDYFVINPTSGKGSGSDPKNVSELPYLVFSFREPAPDKTAPSYKLQTDTQDDMFQYHFAGGTTAFNERTSETGKAYDAYLWVPPQTAPGELKGLVAVKLNLIEVPFVYSSNLRAALAEKNFGILFLACQKDPYGYNNTLNGFYTRKDYEGKDTIYANDTDKWTTDGDNKDAATILNEILTGVAEVSGYSEIKDTVPLITIGHSAASGFGNKSANWNRNRVIAQIHMKNGMSGEEAMVPGVPQLQYAAQYTEHSNGADRDRSVRDARYHIRTKRAVNTDYLVSHIIEWGSGHYDWSDNATYMLTKYITKAIEARLPENYTVENGLNDLTNSGYLMKPFEKDANGSEQEEGYYRDYLQGWLSSGKSNADASEEDKKASFWFFDEEFANEVNKFTNYAIPESPDSRETGVGGKTYSDNEPFMLMKNPSVSTYANTPNMTNDLISPFTSFASNPFSRYGNNRFINYTRMASPNNNANNAANLGGYDTLTVDTYYMNKVPSISTNGTVAYDGAGNAASYPQGQKAEYIPLIAPYEVVDSELLDIDDMTVDEANTEAANVASVTRTTLRFHNNRVYFRSGNKALLGENYNIMDSYGFINSPEVRDASGFVTSPFKATSSQMNVPYVTKGTPQTITLDKIEDVNIYGAEANPIFDVNYTSTDAELQKYTDVFVEYGPAKAVRTVDTDGSYSWKIEILRDQIPENATFPLEVNIVVSNLGKWENTYGATTSQTFNIISELREAEGVTIEGYEGRYDGKEHGVTVSGADGYTVTYEVDGSDSTQIAPKYTDVCEHSVKVTVSKENYSPIEKTVTIKIEKADSSMIAPVKKENLVYNSLAQELVTAGSATGGEMQYSVDAVNYTSSIPTGTDAEEYTIYYKVVGDDNHNDTEPQSMTVTIEKADITGVTITPYKGEYDGNTHGIEISGTQNDDIITYTYGMEIDTETAPSYTDVGDYTVKVKISRGKNYNNLERTVIVKITAEPIAQIIIGTVDNHEADKTKVTVSIENSTDETERGVLIAALYDSSNACKEVKIIDENGDVEFGKTESGYIKAFLWNSLSGMEPILDAQTKQIN